ERARRRARIHDASDVRAIDASLLKRIKAEVDPGFRTEIFSRCGKGYCIVEQERILSVAWGPVQNFSIEIGVETVETHRQRGLATRVAAALIEDCMVEGIEPHASTNAAHDAARRWAQGLGFVDETHHSWIVEKRRR